MQKAGEWLRGMRRGEWLLVLAVLALCVLVLSQGEQQEQPAATDLEARLERVLSAIEGAGQVRVMIAQPERQQESAFAAPEKQEMEITGVLVVCQGAGDLRVRLAIEQAAQTLLGIERSRIEVVPMEGAGE